MDEEKKPKKSMTQEFVESITGEMLRSRMTRKRKKHPQPKPIKQLPGQTHLAPRKVLSAADLRKESIFQKNKALADRTAAEDMEAYNRRQKRQ